MTMDPRAPLVRGVSQFEVDFVVPRVGVDLPLGIDPFLLFKSRDPSLAGLHKNLVGAFNAGLTLVREGQIDDARYILDFPEVEEIGLGYTAKGKRGSGIGRGLTELILETLRHSESLLEKGVRHIEEMQLLSVGIGPDRVSDMAANFLKSFLVTYTQRQAGLWGIPIRSGVPISHVFDFGVKSWADGYFDLPVSPVDGRPILLVPRRIVRTLPWINYDDYLRMEFSAFLRAKRVRLQAGKSRGDLPNATKHEIVAVSRGEIEHVRRYVSAKEAAADQAQPSLNYLDPQDVCPEAEALKRRLGEILPGREQAADYQRIVLEVLNYLFNPELIDGEMEVRSFEETERRDIIFTNDSDESFWSYIRNEHSSLTLMFEVKNKELLETADINQVNTYMGDRLGRLAFIVSRQPISDTIQRKIFSIYNDSNPRKIILAISNREILELLDLKCAGRDPTRYVQKLYRTFRTRVQ